MTAHIHQLDLYRDDPGDDISVMLKAWRAWTTTRSTAARDAALALADRNRERARAAKKDEAA